MTNFFNQIIAIFNLRSLPSQTALRTALAITLAAFTAFALHLENPYWSAITACVVSMSNLGASLERGILRIIGTIAGAALGYVFASLFINKPIMFFSSVFLVIAIGYYYSLVTRYSYSFIIGLVTVSLVMLSAVYQRDSLLHIAIWRSTEIIVGVVAVLLTSYLVFPYKNKVQFTKNLTLFMEQLSQLLDLFNDTLTGVAKIDSAKTIAQLSQLTKTIKESNAIVTFAKKEWGEGDLSENAMAAIVQRQTQLIYQLKFTMSVLSQQADYTLLQQPNLAILDALHALKAVCLNLTQQQEVKAALTRANVALNHLSQQFAVLRQGSEIEQFSTTAVTTVYQFVHLLQLTMDSLININQLMSNGAQPIQIASVVAKSNIFNFRANIENIKLSIKSGLGYLLAIAGWMASNWPGGLQGIISSFVISNQKNIYDAEVTAGLRLLGCAIGGAVGLLLLYFFYMDLPIFLVMLFTFSWVFAYYANTALPIAYASLQANIAFCLTFIQAYGPPTTLTLPLQRLSGIVLGVLGILIVSRLVWPAHPKQLLKHTVNQIFLTLIDYYKAVFISAEADFKLAETNLSVFFTNAEKLITSIKLRKGQAQALANHAQAVIHLQKDLFAAIYATYHTVDINNAYPLLAKMDFSIEEIHEFVLHQLTACQEAFINNQLIKAAQPAQPIIEKILQFYPVLHRRNIGAKIPLEKIGSIIEMLNALRQMVLTCENLQSTLDEHSE